MHSNIKVAVIGGAGKAGKYLVQALLAKGFHLKVLLRSTHITDPLVEVLKGDMKDLSTVRSLLKDCDVVISTIGQPKDEPLISSLATENIITVMNEYGISRYIFIAGITIDIPGDKKSAYNTEMSDFMKRSYPEVVADKQKACELLTASNINWTLVRLPFIVQTALTATLTVGMEDCPGDHINTADLANFLVEQIFSEAYVKKAPFIASL
jgi:putative NADH-flavin reductase